MVIQSSIKFLFPATVPKGNYFWIMYVSVFSMPQLPSFDIERRWRQRWLLQPLLLWLIPAVCERVLCVSERPDLNATGLLLQCRRCLSSGACPRVSAQLEFPGACFEEMFWVCCFWGNGGVISQSKCLAVDGRWTRLCFLYGLFTALYLESKIVNDF